VRWPGISRSKIAVYAGHRNIQTTMLYIHLSGVELAEAVTRGMAGIDRWLAAVLQEGE
jgi:integrase/recombinase XerD